MSAGESAATAERAAARAVEPRADSSSFAAKGAGVLTAVLVVAGIGISVWLSAGERLDGLERWLDAAGAWGIVAFVALVVLWTLTTVPAIPLIAVGGLLFGAWAGALWALVGTTFGAVLTYVLGRRFGRPALARARARYPSVDRLVRKVRRHPVLAVGLVRAAPVFPLTLLNYGFGAARVRFGLYLLASVVTTLPGVAFYAGLADGIRQALREGGVETATLVWVGAVALVSLALGLWLRRRLANGRAR